MVKYIATSQRQLIFSMALLNILLCSLNWEISVIRWICLTLIIVCLLFAFIKYTLVINNNIIYTIRLFGIAIYQKVIIPANIKKVVFKRTGWKSKLATIKLNKGLSIRVSFFKPENVYNDLMEYCEENTIHYSKTKDYTIIEKLG